MEGRGAILRFSCMNGKLVPEALLLEPTETLPISQIKTLPQPRLNPDYPYNEKLQEMLAGKQLILDELPFTLNELQAHYENGYLYYRKSIMVENNRSTCVRCGNQERHLFAAFPCARCREDCTYCRKCIMMGRVSTCTPLVSWSGPVPDYSLLNDPLPIKEQRKEAVSRIEMGQKQLMESTQKNEKECSLLTDTTPQIENERSQLPDLSPLKEDMIAPANPTSLLKWTGTLSDGQKRASSQVVEAIHHSESLLVWAVCGAGKTEVLFAGINTALLAGKRVCLATPRTDVVLELAPRLKKVFPEFRLLLVWRQR